MESRINEDIICVLKKNDSNQFVISDLEIVNPLVNSIRKIEALCDDRSVGLLQISQKINSFNELNLLNSQYNYCEDLSSPYQGFKADTQDLIIEIEKKDSEITKKIEEKEKEGSDDGGNLPAVMEREKFKQYIKATIVKWSKASAINKAYIRCHEDKSVLLFSHRSCGWSNPVFKLTNNLSVEIKTNFGYGSASYFYTILKYKGIEITPFSEWIKYEYAKFSEINRYTQSYELKNESWNEAIVFCQKACNLSIKDEHEFVKKHILSECEEMVSGLEYIFRNKKFSFKPIKPEQEEYSKDIDGHELIEFRGEKISGALDFVSKILDFDQIAQIKYFISRIEDCNRRLQPILIEESEILKVKLQNHDSEMKELSPAYKALHEKIHKYHKEKNVIWKKLFTANKITATEKKNDANLADNNTIVEKNEDINKQTDKLFNEKFPEYNGLKKEHSQKKKEYNELTEKIKIKKNILKKILKYNDKIHLYFE